MKKKRDIVHFHNGHSLQVWCGAYANRVSSWTTVAKWVTCQACRRMAEEAFKQAGLDL